jgi:hypothetical protein
MYYVRYSQADLVMGVGVHGGGQLRQEWSKQSVLSEAKVGYVAC